MNRNAQENSKRYNRWLIAMGLVGGMSGWVTQGMMGGFLVWTLPLFCLGAAAFTLNGDGIVESLIVLFPLGGVAFVTWGYEPAVAKLGAGTICGAYVALCVSKLGFALAKSGLFRNSQFS
jgi:hypothetical protein